MTELLYYVDGYRKSIDASVIGVLGNAIILDKTIFYPECGGQPGDKGTFGLYRIVDTEKGKDGTPLHIIDGAMPAVGDKFTLTLDWDHRYKYMKEHSAQHLISATLFNDFSIGTVSVHQGERILTIETDKAEIPDDVLLKAEDSVNAHVREGVRIYQKEVDHESAERLSMRRSIKVDGDVKLVYIEGIDVVACGGVHVANTREIGEVHYKGQELIRGHVRTIWAVSDEAVKERRESERVIKEACRLLSSTKENLASEIERMLGLNNELKHKVKALSEAAAEREYCDNENNAEGAIIFRTELPLDLFQSAVSPEREVFIAGDGTFLYQGTKERFLILKEKLSLRGGGKSTMFRGSYSFGGDIISAASDILRG